MTTKIKAGLLLGLFAASIGVAQAGVTMEGNNTQDSKVDGFVINMAGGAGAEATQQISSIKGSDVTIRGNNTQTTDVKGFVANAALMNNAKATQQISSILN